MSRTVRLADALLTKVGFPLLGLSGLALHFLTVWYAFMLAAPGPSRYIAALAAYLTPPLAEAVVAYLAWRELGSKVNSYSIWILLWIVLLVAVLSLRRLVRGLRRRLPPSPDRLDEH